MPAGSYSFTIEQGATFEREFTYKPDGAEGAPADLTNYTARMQIRTTVDAADPATLTLTTTNNRIILGGVAGTIKLLLTDEETAALAAPFTGVYDLELEDPAGAVIRLMQGQVTVTPEVTRVETP